jgi:hypothetical protein
MELSPIRKKRLAAASMLVAVSFMVYMLGGSGPVGPPYRDENLTAGPEPLMVVRHPAVRKELKLTEAQAKQIDSVIEKQSAGRGGPDRDAATKTRMARMGRKHQEAYLSRVLQPKQMTRLKQIILQQQGGMALNNSQTAEALGLSEKQRKKADAILDKLTERMSQLRNTRGREAFQQMQEARETAGKQLLALLTDEQESRWKDLLGEPFLEELRFGPGGGGFPGRGPGGPGGPGGPPQRGRPGQGPGGPPQGDRGPSRDPQARTR